MRAYRWSDVKSEAHSSGRENSEQVAEHEKRMLAELRAYRLAEFRERYNVSQTTLAERIGVSQSRVSRIERGDVERAGISTIRDYVEALGGEVEVIAKFGDERIVIA
ncbi:XRE family transcriptional regulator [soil metagenome]